MRFDYQLQDTLKYQIIWIYIAEITYKLKKITNLVENVLSLPLTLQNYQDSSSPSKVHHLAGETSLKYSPKDFPFSERERGT